MFSAMPSELELKLNMLHPVGVIHAFSPFDRHRTRKASHLGSREQANKSQVRSRGTDMHTLRLFMVYACAHAQTAGAFMKPLLQNPDYQERCRSSPSLLPVVVHRARIHTGTTSTSTSAPTQHHVGKSRLFFSLQLYASESNESEDRNDNDNSNADADSDSSTVDSSANTTLFDFYRDLRNAKNDKLGGTIPPEQLQRAAEDSTNDFLTAMKEVTEDFEAAKAEIGADAACDLLLTQIRQDEEEQEQQQQQQQQQGEQDNGSDNNSGFQ